MALVGEAHILVKAITTGVQNDIDKAFGGADSAGDKAGRNAGKSFSRGFNNNTDGKVLFGKFYTNKEVAVFKKARQDFLDLAAKGYILGTAITAVSGIVGSLVGGLGVLALTVGAAVGPAFLGLLGTLGAVAAAAAALKTVFSGVGDALKAQSKSTAGEAERAKAIARATRDLADAKYNYAETVKETQKRTEAAAKAIEDAADAEVDAKREVEAAERTYQDSVEATTEALEAVTQAREDAKEAIQQLRFELEGGVISEKKARLEFEKARDSLQRVQDLPPNSRARREAELAFAEADLNLRRAIDKNGDLRKATAKANKEGINGNKNVLAAEKSLIKARQSQSDAEIGAFKAKKDLTKATLDLAAANKYAEANGELVKKNLRDLELANRAVTDATVALSEAQKSGGLGEYEKALKKLSPEAQKFVKAMKPIKEDLTELKKKMQEKFFPGFTEAVTELAEVYIPLLTPSLEALAGKLGDIAVKFKNAFVTPEKQAEIKLLFDDFVVITGNLGDAFIDLSSGFVTLMAAFSPYVVEFSEFVKKKAEAFKNSVEEKKANGELNDIFEKGVGVLKDLGEAFGNTFSTLANLLDAATGPGSGGQLLLDWLKETTADWEKFTAGGDQNTGLKDTIRDLADNFTKLADFAGQILAILIKVAASEGFGKFIDKLKEAAPIIEDVALKISDALPAFGDFVISLAKFVKLVVDAAPIKLFFGILKGALDVLIFVLDNPIGKAFLAFSGLLLAASVGLNKVAGGVRFYKNALLGAKANLLDFKDAVMRNVGLLKAKAGALKQVIVQSKLYTIVSGALNKVLKGNPLFLILGIIVLVIGALVTLYKKNEAFREIVDKVWGAIKDTIGVVVDAVVGYFKIIIEFAQKLWDPILTALKFVWGLVEGYFKLIFGFWKAIIETIIGIGLIVWNFLLDGLKLIWSGVEAYFKIIFGFWKKIIDGFILIGSIIWNFIKDKLVAVWDTIKAFWDNTIYPFASGIIKNVKDKAGAIWNFISSTLSDAWDKVKGFWDNTIYPFFDKIKTKIASIGSTLWDGLKSGLSGVVNFIIDKLNFMIKAVNFLIAGANKVKIGEDIKPIKLIDPVNFAMGGIVPATRGGIIARIGEAGRPERVEPLDPDGLSKRDKAMIAFMSGGAGGGVNITVNPAPGMDERELANLVSRQLAFQLRKGAA